MQKESAPDSRSGHDDPEVALPPQEDPFALTIVALGGSAGSIPALNAFFQGVPAETGSAYVVVLHLSPEHESHLVEVLERATSLPILEVSGPVVVERGHVYVIPPGKQLEMQGGTLQLGQLAAGPSGTRIAIDTFFRTLAEAQGPQAVAVVLSGSGADGTLGLRQIKEAGGLAVVQSPGEAQYDAMPRSAIATGLVDYVLPAAAMPTQIEAYWETSRRMRLPAEATASPQEGDEGAEQERALGEILIQVRALTGHDFARYKRATVLRRIGRRMQVSGLETLPAYLDFLRRHPTEVGALVGDLLISVTRFFRDPQAWQSLERDVLPRLFEDKQGEQDQVRAWVCGCATGEEAYTVAILLLEQAARSERRQRIQVFATDMDVDAIGQAREGIYPETISADVDEERLRRWFYRQGTGTYQVRKEVREIVLFAAHDVLKDTPFSRLDLITCRNLLIYLNREAQEQVFETFHFALRPDGRLMLGPSESSEGASFLFGATNKPHRLYVRRPVARSLTPPLALPSGPGGPQGYPSTRLTVAALSPFEMPASPSALLLPALPAASGAPRGGAAELHRSLLELYAPPSVLIGPDHEIVHLSERAGRFLRIAGGEPTRNLLQLVHPGLRIDLRAALYTAVSTGGSLTRLAQSVELTEGAPRVPVRLSVRPVEAPEGARGYVLVLFEELPARVAPSSLTDDPPEVTTDPNVARQLEEENAALQRQLRATIEQYEAMNEELKASNEELQAMNEEQRSATEELETSKEELQSLNEELSTVNHELQMRVEEVSRTNSDLHNFLASNDIGTIFLDRSLLIKRFTPAAQSLFNLISTDVGRPLIHLSSQLDYPTLQQDAEEVLARLTSVEREIVSTDGQRRFLARLLPYRSLDDRIEGVVINLIDISARTQAEEALRESQARLQLALDAANMGTFLWHVEEDRGEPDSRMRTLFGLPPEGELSLADALITLIHPEDRQAYTEAVARATDPAGDGSLRTETRIVHPDGAVRWLALTAQTYFAATTRRALRMSGVAADITERKQAESALRDSQAELILSEARLSAIFARAAVGLSEVGLAGELLRVNDELCRFLGRTREDLMSVTIVDITHPDDLARTQEVMASCVQTGGPFSLDNRYVRPDGIVVWANSSAILLRDEAGQPRGFLAVTADLTERRRLEDALRTAAQELERRVDERTQSLNERSEQLADMSQMRLELLRQLVSVQEEERARISRDLHDDTGQQMTGLLLGLKNLSNLLTLSADSEAHALLLQLQSLARDVAKKSHQLSSTLRPTSLDDIGLIGALQNYVEQWSRWSGLRVKLQGVGLEQTEGERLRLSPEIGTTIYRVVQEALTNVQRHAVAASDDAQGGAHRVDIVVQCGAGEVVTVIEDDGPGFDVDAALGQPLNQRRLGLFGMQERARLAGGTLTIESRPGEGTTLFLRLPLPDA